MKFAVSEDVIKKATKCRSNFSCLSGEGVCLCEIEDFAGDKLHFIKPGTGECDYRMGFGFSYLCNCPVRKEIYNQYRV